ncbi:hypothetical protein Tco_0052006, partial [Tanacetum coccineum]
DAKLETAKAIRADSCTGREVAESL